MLKKELVTAIAEKTGMTKKASENFIDVFTQVVVDALSEGDEIKIAGFGKFEVIERPERVCRNPATGEQMTVEASRAPKFRFSQGLKEMVKEA